MDKKKYFVNIESTSISETSVPIGLEYEVVATINEINEVESLLNKLTEDSKTALKYLVKPFNEEKVDDERQKYDEHLMALYRTIYKIGTQKTKIIIEEMGILKQK